MPTLILSNGSKWAGDQLDTIDDLIKVLGTHALDRRFERCGNFIMPLADEAPKTREGLDAERAVQFWGNFAGLSHVFDIRTDEPETIARVSAAIRANQQRPNYLSQPDAAAQLAAIERENARRDEQRRKDRAARGLR